MKKVALVVDNSAAMSEQDLIKANVKAVVPISFIVNGEEYYEGKNMTYGQFFEFLKDKGKEYAIIDVAYFVHEDKKVIKTMEKFTLRKDSEGKWKILFWEIGKVSDMEG